MIKYKLTTQDLTTYNGFRWEIGRIVETSGEGDLCGPGWLHYYHHPLLSVLFNPIHAAVVDPKLFEVEASGIHKDDRGLKGGCTVMTLIREIPLPTISVIRKVGFAILCVKEVYTDPSWVEWADNWLSNIDRTKSAASAAYDARTAGYTAFAALYAAEAAAAATAFAADAAESDFVTTTSATAAAVDVAAFAAHASGGTINFVDIVTKAMTI